MINKKLGMLFGGISLLVMALFFITAFGVSTPYWDDYPLKLAPGESTIVTLGLQNGVGSENVTLRAELTSDGNGIASLVDEDLDYFVPLGGGAGVLIKVEVPEEASIPGVHQITVRFTQVSLGGEGMVSVSGGFSAKFPVEIVVERESVLFEEETQKEGVNKGNLLLGAVLIVLLIIALIYFLRKNKR